MKRTLAELQDFTVEGVLNAVRRDLNCLTDANRSTRKDGAERLRKRLLEDEAFTERAKDILPEILSDVVIAPVARMLNDPAEKCREAALLFVKAAAKVLPDTSLLFQRVVPVLRSRMGSEDVHEPSEELRLWSIQLLRGDIARKCNKSRLQAYIDEIVPIVVKGLDDSFHEVKKETCRFVVDAPNLLSRGDLEGHMETILKCIVRNMSHPHFKVRLMLVSAVDALVGLKPPKALIDKFVVTILHEVCFDKAHQVRRKSYDSIASWLTLLDDDDEAEEAEAESEEAEAMVPAGPRVPVYAEILLPFYLLGLLDEEEAIRESAGRNLKSLCEKNSENGCYLSADMDVGDEGSQGDHVKGMVRFHLRYITGVCKRDLAEWTASKKLAAARLLNTATKLSEADVTPYLDVVVPLLFGAVGDESEEVAHLVVSSSQHVGASCDPSAWLFLVLDSLSNAKSSVAQKANTLVVLAGLVHGCSRSGRAITDEMLTSLASTLASEEIRGAGYGAINMQLLSVITNVLGAFGKQCKVVSQELYHVLLQLQALRGDPATREGAFHVTESLATLCGYDSSSSFASDHSRDLLHMLCGGHAEWTKDSPDQFVFSALVFSCSSDVLASLFDEISSVFSGCLTQERDPHIRLEMLKLLDRLLEDDSRNAFLRGQPRRFLSEVLLPPAVWQVGKTAASIRFHAVVVLGTFFRKKLVSAEELARILDDESLQLLPTLHSSLEEDYYADTRLASCHTLEALLLVIGRGLTDDQKRAVYPELLKRLDDSDDKVRIQTCATLEAFVTCLGPDYDDTNTGYLLKGVLIHMDDTNPHVQEAVCLMVEKLAAVKPHVTRSCLHEVRDQHRGVGYVDRILGIL